MQFSSIISDIERIANLSGTAHRNTLKRGVNTWLLRYAAAYTWPHYKDRGVIQTIAPYETGTVTATNASKTITGDSTVFTAAMVGRKFQVSGDQAWYTVSAYVSATEITLAESYQGTTASGSSYSIFKDEYRIDADTHQLLDVVQTQNQIKMGVFDYLRFDDYFSQLGTFGEPEWLTVLGRKDDTYATGTITASAGSTTLTGSSTAWTGVEGLSKGSRLAGINNTEVYTIKSVDSDTQLTTYEQVTTALSASTYRLFLNNIRVQVWPVPSAARNLYYRKQRLPNPLFNDYDEPDMAREFHGQLVDAGLATAYTLLGQLDRAAALDAHAKEWIQQQIAQVGLAYPMPKLQKHIMDANYAGLPTVSYY